MREQFERKSVWKPVPPATSPTTAHQEAAFSDEASRWQLLETNSRSTFVNAGKPGINQVLPVGGRLLISNIGRNFELWDRCREPQSSPGYRLRNVTVFPRQDIPSQLDIDVHGAFLTAAGDLAVANHYGLVRLFSLPGSRRDLVPYAELQLPGDCERLLLAADCIIASSPRGQLTPGPAGEGIFLSRPLYGPRRADAPEGRCELADWGVVSALAASGDAQLLAVGAGERLGLFRLAPSADGIELRENLWQRRTGFHIQWLSFDAPGRLLAAGYDLGASDPEGGDWEDCNGGSVCLLTLEGERLAQVRVPDHTAWGYAANPITASTGGSRVFAVDRFAGLHVLSPGHGAWQTAIPPSEAASLGIGHCCLWMGCLYAGFTRGGYRLWRFCSVRDSHPRLRLY